MPLFLPHSSIVFASIPGFFNNLQADIVTFGLAGCAFFFSWAAFLYMTAGENERQIMQAKSRLYAALVGLVLILLAVTITTLINNAAIGQ